MATEKSCSLLVHFEKGTPAMASEIKEALEGRDMEAKIEALKKAIMLLVNGETIPQLFNTIIRYVLTSEDHMIQKLLLQYLEIVDKTDSRGKILPEMILICQNLRNNLQHPNEFIRGAKLRFLCRIREPEIVEPLVPLLLANLEHRHAFVRRCAVLAIMSVYRLPGAGDQLIPDAPEVVEKFLSSEQDPSAKRNAFLMLFTCDQDRAVRFLFENVERVVDWGEPLQMLVLELIKKVWRENKGEKSKYMKIIMVLHNAPSTAVVYECAGTLLSLSSGPNTVQAAAWTYCRLLLSQSDNNVKLIVLDRLNELRGLHREIMVEMVMDVMCALSIPNQDIRRKTLDIVLDLITPRNVHEVVLVLKKQFIKTQRHEYRLMLLQAIQACVVKFPVVAAAVVHLLMDFLGDSNAASANDVTVFVREAIQTNAKLRLSILTTLLDTFYQIPASQVCSEDETGIAAIKQCLGDFPFFTPPSDEPEQSNSRNLDLHSEL